MLSKSEESRIAAVGVILVASWLTTFYLFRQNKLLRTTQCHENNDSSLEKETEQDTTESDIDDQLFVMQEIGVIRSPFPQRAGCPRQGTLAPHVKSLLVLHPHIPAATLDGIMGYSHVWILFNFHLNPRGKAKSSSGSSNKTRFTSSKVRPPRANGLKVGVLATRAPHRPNPVGLSLALLEDVTVVRGYNGSKQTCLVLRGLDLVDGTPVYDVKPLVPWDRIDGVMNATSVSYKDDTNEAVGDDLHVRMKQLKVPSWVSADDELAQVKWTQSARDDLYEKRNYLKPWYDATNDGVEEASRAIEEIIAQDPRAVRDGRGHSTEETFEFTFGELRIRFLVDSDKKEASIVEVIVDEGDMCASKASYPHNLALRRLAEKEAREHGKKLEWVNPVREGVTKGLFDLRGGDEWKPKLPS